MCTTWGRGKWSGKYICASGDGQIEPWSQLRHGKPRLLWKNWNHGEGTITSCGLLCHGPIRKPAKQPCSNARPSLFPTNSGVTPTTQKGFEAPFVLDTTPSTILCSIWKIWIRPGSPLLPSCSTIIFPCLTMDSKPLEHTICIDTPHDPHFPLQPPCIPTYIYIYIYMHTYVHIYIYIYTNKCNIYLYGYCA